MRDNTAFLSRVYALYGSSRAVDLAPLLGLKSANAVRRWQDGTGKPGLATLLRIKIEKGEDLGQLVLAGESVSSPSYGTAREEQRGASGSSITAADYIRRVEEDHREAKRAGRRKDDRVPLIQLMAALRRITASEDWAKRSAVIQVLLAFDPEVRDDWPRIQVEEVAALRHLLSMDDAERQQERKRSDGRSGE